MRNQLLLLEDVEDLGRSGDVVSVKPGYSRNFLVPQKKAVVADKFTLRMQARLQEERSKQAQVDRAESEGLSKKLEGMVLGVEVKVDPDGHMYGSVSAVDIVNLFDVEGIKLEKRNVVLLHPIKSLGVHLIQLKLKEGIPAEVTLHVIPEGGVIEEFVQEPAAPEA